MSSLSFEAFGEPSSILKAGNTVAVEEPSSGQVKVSLTASPVTAEDIRSLRGLSTHCAQTGIAGTYGVGTVAAVGSGVVGVSASSQVFVASSGTWNSEALLSAQEVFPIDSETALDSSQAACLPEAASAWALLHNFAALSAGDVVVRSAEASPLNSAIDQIAKAEGVVVVPASDSDLVDAKFKDKVASKGTVKLAVTSGTGKSARAMHALSGSKGVLVTYNGAIAPLTDTFSGVEVPSLALIFEDKAVCGFDFKSWAANSPAEASQAISASVKLIQNGQLKFSPVKFPAAKFAEAVDAASSGKSAVLEL
jgi:NADPH:quinone reductase-like Zn-dependent oxidoreductase